MPKPPGTYLKPPVKEVVCEFRFQSSQPWDWTIPGLVYEKIRETFPKKQQESGFEMNFEVAQDKTPVPQVRAGIAKMRFLKEDDTALVQIGPNLLAVNHLKYPGWGDFKPTILDQLKTYREVAQPGSLSRIGLRYINRIAVPKGTIDLDEYFNVKLEVPSPMPQTFARFRFEVEIPYELNSQSSMLRLIFQPPKVPGTGDRTLFQLDLDMFVAGNDVPSLDDASAWIDAAHGEVKKAFLACLTRKSHKEIFEEIE